MKRFRSKELQQASWQTEARHALLEFDTARYSAQRLAALKKLQPLFDGKGKLKEALRRCLTLANRAERM
jgi:hypothetical protein